jgi:hypothetical protein
LALQVTLAAGVHCRYDAAMPRAILLSRKDVAALFGSEISVDIIRKNEKRLGLDKCRVDVNCRKTGYRKREALRILRAKGFLL